MKKVLLILVIVILSTCVAYADNYETTGGFEFSDDFPVITPYSSGTSNSLSVAYYSNADYIKLRKAIVDFEKCCEFRVNIPYTLKAGETVVQNGYLTKTISNQIYNFVVSKYGNMYFNILFENPELMQAATSYVYSCTVYDYTSTQLNASVYFYPEYIITEEQLSNALCIADGIVADVIDHSMTDEEKALVLHDYIIDNVTYNLEYSETNIEQKTDEQWRNHTAYGALVNNLAVCQGYTLAYNMLLNRVGIEAKFVSSSKLNHGWSLVKLGNNWYHADTTHDDPTNVVCVDHSHFLLSDERIKALGHTSWDNITVECNDDKYSTVNYCFHDVNPTKETIHYRDGYFYAYRHLHVKQENNVFNLLPEYGYSKTYTNNIFTNDNGTLFVYEYVKSKFDGSEFDIITKQEYDNSFVELYDFDINPFYAKNGVSVPVTIDNISNSVIFIKNERDCNYCPDAYFVFYDTDGRIIKANRVPMKNKNVYWFMSKMYPAESVGRVSIFVWQGDKMMPVAENITVQ